MFGGDCCCVCLFGTLVVCAWRWMRFCLGFGVIMFGRWFATLTLSCWVGYRFADFVDYVWVGFVGFVIC